MMQQVLVLRGKIVIRQGVSDYCHSDEQQTLEQLDSDDRIESRRALFYRRGIAALLFLVLAQATS